jgi:hypothetical protein
MIGAIERRREANAADLGDTVCLESEGSYTCQTKVSIFDEEDRSSFER